MILGNMKYTLYIMAVASAMLLDACQRDGFAGQNGQASDDGVVSYAPEIVSGEVMSVKSAVSARELVSADGSFRLPLSLQVAGCSATSVKSTLINESGAAKPFDDYASAIGNTFMVTAWSSASARIIPSGTGLGECVSNNYQKVMFRDKSGGGKYWMTVQPQTVSVSGAPTLADDEYLWKAGETKTFYAYANLPSGGASVTNTAATVQQLEVTSTPCANDILLGYYSGEGKTGVAPDLQMTATASIRFYHPLTAVRFKLGSLPEGKSITGISVSGVYQSGKTTQSSASSAFSWTRTDGNSFSKSDETGTVSLSSCTLSADNTIGEALLLIPQTFASDGSARIAVTLSGGKTVYCPLGGTTWSPGCVNIYTIGYAE